MAEYSQTDDDDFAAFAKRAEEEAQAQKSGSSGSYQQNYDPIEWVGLEENTPKIIRFVGKPPASLKPGIKSDGTNAQEIFISSVMDDNNKRCEIRLPMHDGDTTHDHIMHRIINAVKAVDWIPDPNNPGKNTKKFRYEKYPWFDKVVHGGYDQINDPINYKQSKGWAGQQVCIMNVIDREDTWCHDNNHTKLLSKKINQGKDGKLYPFKGVPSFGFCNLLSNMISGYGNWEHYDVAICRTSVMTSPVKIWDTPVTLQKKSGILPTVLKAKESIISTNDNLTEEELSYDRYDISHFFAPITYQKIMKHFGNTIKAIDADLNRNFYEELQTLVEKEKAEFKEKFGDDDNAPAQTVSMNESSSPVENDPIDPMTQPVATAHVAAPATPVAEKPVISRTISTPAASTTATGLTPEKIALLKGWANLSDYEKSMIIDVVVVDGKLDRVVYSPNAKPCVVCPTADGGCGKDAPSDFTSCPVCGASYVS